MSGSTSGHTPSPAGAARAAGGGTGAAHGTRRLPSAAHPVQAQALAPVPSPRRQGESLAHGWPLRDYVELGALDSAVPCARHRTRCILWEWQLARLSDDVELVVDELLANAVSASRRLGWPHPVRMWLLSDRASVLIMVWDANPQPPVRIDPAGDAECGRGLLLVDAIAARWDWYPLPDAGGKVIRALVTR